MLTHMLGNSYSMQDFLTYLLGGMAIMAMGLSKAMKAAQLPLVLLMVMSIVAERLLIQSFPQYLDVDPTGQVSHQHSLNMSHFDKLPHGFMVYVTSFAISLQTLHVIVLSLHNWLRAQWASYVLEFRATTRHPVCTQTMFKLQKC